MLTFDDFLLLLLGPCSVVALIGVGSIIRDALAITAGYGKRPKELSAGVSSPRKSPFTPGEK